MFAAGKVVTRLVSRCPWHRCHRSGSRLCVRDALTSHGGNTKKVKIQGWVRSVRAHKEVLFLHINDGSSLQNLQIVAEPSLQHRYRCLF
ncbi:unnamed protein product [Staurois parvus]|uniref:OB domain-containing protein n=1 Tax=Staurois parvus TaxID=386267 RepID=A0ABN9BD51_9NEOB|nr:unnamed protein product [Staurois parvus]